MHIEVQKARMAQDIDALVGTRLRHGEPLVRIYLLGDQLDRQLPTRIKVGRRYLKRVGQPMSARHYCFRSQDHDVGPVEMPLQTAQCRFDLEALLRLFSQSRTADAQGHSLKANCTDTDSPLLQRVLAILSGLLDCPELRAQMAQEDSMQQLLLTAENHALKLALEESQRQNDDLREQLGRFT